MTRWCCCLHRVATSVQPGVIVSYRQSVVRPSVWSPAQAVIFDLDDTLFNHVRSVRRALSDWLPALGAASSPFLVRAWFEVETRHFETWRAGLISFDEQRRRRLRDFLPLIGGPVGLSDSDLDAAFAGYLHFYEQSWVAFDDVRPVLDSLAAQQVAIAVLTNGNAAQQHAKVAAIGLEDVVAAVLTSEELGFAKPAPQTYLAACQLLGVDPGRAVHVGDRHDIDVLAARAAGLRALHLDRNDRRQEPPEGRITTLHELPGRLAGG